MTAKTQVAGTQWLWMQPPSTAPCTSQPPSSATQLSTSVWWAHCVPQALAASTQTCTCRLLRTLSRWRTSIVLFVCLFVFFFYVVYFTSELVLLSYTWLSLSLSQDVYTAQSYPHSTHKVNCHIWLFPKVRLPCCLTSVEVNDDFVLKGEIGSVWGPATSSYGQRSGKATSWWGWSQCLTSFLPPDRFLFLI